MGKGTQPKTERNEQLAIDYQRKNADGGFFYTVKQLEDKYDLTSTRIYSILKSMGVSLDRPHDNISKYNKSRKS